MLILLSEWLSQWYHAFGVFQYLTLRAIMAAISAMIFALWMGPGLIRYLTRIKMGQSVRDDGPSTHLVKSGTPTMGGTMILLSVTFSVLLWGNLANHYLWLVLLTTLAFGAIGFVDDYLKVVKRNPKGIRARTKYFWQSVFALMVAVYLYTHAQIPAQTELLIPFMKATYIPIGLGFIVLVYFVIVGTSNAVNLTDGLDGLAIMPTVLISTALGVFAYVTGHAIFADYLDIPFVPGVGEVAIFAGALAGAGLGFLWFNTYPAQVFMGDVGSLALGAALGLMAVLVRQELVLVVMGGVFVMETLSVILQVTSYRLTGRRIFRMAPIHHHFELQGWAEPKVIVRFWIITLILVLIGLASLKIR